MFCEKLEFTNNQIHKYVQANNKFLGIIVEICNKHIHVCACYLSISVEYCLKVREIDPKSLSYRNRDLAVGFKLENLLR